MQKWPYLTAQWTQSETNLGYERQDRQSQVLSAFMTSGQEMEQAYSF